MTTSVDPRLRQLWTAARGPVAIGLLVLLGAVIIAVVSMQADRGLLDPRATDEAGSRAVAEVLRGQGVGVELTRDTARAASAGPDTTVLVTFPDRLAPSQLTTVARTRADLVLVAPGPDALAELAPGIAAAGQAPVQQRPAQCALPAARAAGGADTGGRLYRTGNGQQCYPVADGAALVQAGDAGRTVTVIGAPDMLTNTGLPEAGNAALALRLLGQQNRLLWYLPVPGEVPAAEQKSFAELVGPGWLWGAAQLGIAAVLLALWRARRLGPVVAEPLPVVVRAAETVEGQARLYRRVGARDHAAQTLRDASCARLRPLLGLPVAAEPGAVAVAAASRTGRSGSEVTALLYGPAPADDTALVRLADNLDTLETEVGRS
ncbi:MAG: DUF4350 domain-containing protein [Pseudonocardiaceae bacterium]|nr:DUF4350 domain-containing protein [Pseudonocardiaceae bacterium]